MINKKMATSLSSSLAKNSATIGGKDGVDPDKLLLQLFENGHGCNITLYNPNPVKEGDYEVEDRFGQNLNSTQFNNSGQSNLADK